MSSKSNVTTLGCSLGSVIAVVISWERSHSILWAILHGICTWAYVVWFAVWGRP